MFKQIIKLHSNMNSADEREEDEGEKDSVITVNKYTHNPIKALSKLRGSKHFKVDEVKPMDARTPISPDKVRFVCISDTHAQIERLVNFVPPGDVLLHAGDITTVGLPHDVEKFNTYLGTLPHKHKLVIAGNHDLTFDPKMVGESRKDLDRRFCIRKKSFEDFLESRGLCHPAELLTNCTYLVDESIQVCGIKLYGSPWQPEFCSWAFNLPRGQPCLDVWNKIPSDTEIVMTHGPPLGHGDLCSSHMRAGCVELLSTIQKRVKPSYHVFGHIHEAYGVTTDGHTIYINASTCNLRYKPVNPPIVFDMPLPDGYTKDDIAPR